MAENDSAPGLWGHHNLKTAADVRRMLRGEAPPDESHSSMSGMKTEQGAGEARPEGSRPTPSLPPAAVTATVETVDEQPLKTVETVQVLTQTEPPTQPDEPSFLVGLDLNLDQFEALNALGITDRAGLVAALDGVGDKGFAGLSRTEVRKLRKQLGG